MKRARLLLPLLPLVAGAFYLRSLASWRPQKLFVGATRISQLTFSSDGRVLLVGQMGHNYLSGYSDPRLMALDAAHGFVTRWSYEGGNNFIKPRFFLGDSRVLVCGEYLSSPQVLDASTGHLRHDYRTREAAVISMDGKWLVSSDDDYVTLEPGAAKTQQWKPDGIKLSVARGETMSSAPAISPDSRTVVMQITEFYRSRLDFIDIASRTRTRIWPDSPSRVFGKGIQWSRNGRYLLSVWYFPTQPLGIQTSWSLWRVSDGRKLASTTYPFNEIVPHFEVEDDGRVLSYWTNNQVLLSQPTLRASVSKPQLELSGETVTAATLSQDGTRLVAGTASGRVYSQRLK